MFRRKFKPGDMAPVNGIYLVTHPSHDYAGGPVSGETVFSEGDRFPGCPECRIAPSYEYLAPVGQPVEIRV
jgi:hypothetical protein